MLNVSFEETALLVRTGVTLGVASPRASLVVVVVCPLCEVVRELVAWKVSASVLKVDHDQLLVLVGRLKERRLLVVWTKAQNVAVLSL